MVAVLSRCGPARAPSFRDVASLARLVRSAGKSNIAKRCAGR
jgi:hypothetical protein